MRGASIFGYGSCYRVHKPGCEGDFLATGFSPRKTSLTVCIMPGCSDFGDIRNRRGKHGTGRSCPQIYTLDAVDEDALRELISAGLRNLASRRPVAPD